MTIGASLIYSISGDCAFSSSAIVDFGVNASLPDSALIVADYGNHGASSTSGFDSSQLTPIFDVKSESASMKLSASSQPAISLGVDLKTIGKFGMTVSFNLPELSATLTVAHGTYLIPVCLQDKE